MASETRELTVMFTDIVRFSEISERMGAEETAAFLNRHFGLLAECIEVEGGTIDKYIGDAMMAFWGAPDRMEDHAARAVRAARRIAETITADNARRAKKGLQAGQRAHRHPFRPGASSATSARRSGSTTRSSATP